MTPTLAKQVVNCPTLPTLPAIARALLRLDTESPDIADISAIIQQNPAVSVKLLRLVNSSLYGQGRKVRDLAEAADRLGIQSLRTLLLGFSLADLFGNGHAGTSCHLQYWRRSMYAATAAHVIAERVGIPCREDCFVAALLMDVGVMAMDRVLGISYRQTWRRVATHADLPVIESHLYATDHAEVGGLLAERWQLPPRIAIPIRAHHDPFAVEESDIRQVVQVIWLAGCCADIFVTASQAAEQIMEVRKAFMQQYQMTALQCDGMLCAIGRKSAELAHLFEVRLTTPVSFERVVDQAATRLTELSLAEKQGTSPSNRRQTQRRAHNGRMTIIPCSRGILEPPQQVRLHDISSHGLGFTHEVPMLRGQQFVIQLPDGRTGAIKTLLYTVVHCDIRGGIANIGAQLTSVLRPESVLQAEAA